MTPDALLRLLQTSLLWCDEYLFLWIQKARFQSVFHVLLDGENIHMWKLLDYRSAQLINPASFSFSEMAQQLQKVVPFSFSSTYQGHLSFPPCTERPGRIMAPFCLPDSLVCVWIWQWFFSIHMPELESSPLHPVLMTKHSIIPSPSKAQHHTHSHQHGLCLRLSVNFALLPS